MKNLSKNLNFYRINKKFAFNKAKSSFKNSTILKLKTKEYEDWSNIASLVSNNFRMKNSSQVYTSGEDYQGYLEFDSGAEELVDRERVNQLIKSYAGSNDFVLNSVSAGVKLVASREDREKVLSEFQKGESAGKKCSVFSNNKKLAGVISCQLNASPNGLRRNGEERSDDYGYFLNKLEENLSAYEVIEIQGCGGNKMEYRTTESLRVTKFISLVRSNPMLKHKLISVKTSHVLNN